MFCPKCRVEYRDGFTVCADCDVSLVAVLPPVPDELDATSDLPEADLLELVTVYRTSSYDLLLVAKELLEEAGIEYLTRNEFLRGQCGAEHIGYKASLGPVEVLVRPDDAEAAISVLRALEHLDV